MQHTNIYKQYNIHRSHVFINNLPRIINGLTKFDCISGNNTLQLSTYFVRCNNIPINSRVHDYAI